MKKNYEELDFTDDFMFCKVLTNNPELCHELLELVIGKKVGKFTRLDKQKPIEITADGKGIRFDVYSEDEQDIVYDCEMQTSGNDNLPKRTRYYQGMIDLNLIERGADYSELKKSYIIFICTFDVFGQGLHKYTFRNYCEEFPPLELDDESTKIFLCAGGEGECKSQRRHAERDDGQNTFVLHVVPFPFSFSCVFAHSDYIPVQLMITQRMKFVKIFNGN